MRDFTIEQLSPDASDDEVDRVVTLLTMAGKRWYIREYLRAIMMVGQMVILATIGGKVIGVVVLDVLGSVETAIFNSHIPLDCYHLSTDPPCLMVADVVVRPDYRRLGVATALVSSALVECRLLGGDFFSRAIAVSRVPKVANEPTSLDLLNNLGFSEVVRVDGYYGEAEEFRCPSPSCGETCSCFGVLMLKEMAGTTE